MKPWTLVFALTSFLAQADGSAFHGRFEGPATATVRSVVVNHVDETRYDRSAIDQTSGSSVLRTDLTVELAPDATIGQVQPTLDALDALGARVVASLKGRDIISIRFPDPGSLAMLERLRAKLEASPGIRGVRVSTLPPGGGPPPPLDPATKAALAVMARHVGQLRECVNAPRLPAISLIITIAPSGRVVGTKVTPSEYEHGVVGSCLREGIRGAVFEPSEKETSIEVPFGPSRVFTVASQAVAPPRVPRHPFVRSFTPTAAGATISVPVGSAATGKAELVVSADRATRPAFDRLAAGDPRGALRLLEPCATAAAPSEPCLVLQMVALVFRDDPDDLSTVLQLHQRLSAAFPSSRARPAIDQLVQIETR